ncbi:Sir2 family transcriptional regulator [Thermosulfidibacter takaii ABI70S6]|uniref:protein acetyllysine N-acetyltransferase n=1 Tax=Thermosulfidibacter takaii (strain DSM 17441 / JCM 13301 / NBRC 103674 / ABI70S6) TaxID=1298851 RepID=A0A0S3QTI0_THET7|nr:Sir2 family transcriptional regulator [Thermosulfidibacter takaii ABI70S6]
MDKAAQAITEAEVLIITAGAGIGVDSGLPDFRGDKGFWKAYPLYERLGLNFVEMANPYHFERDPAFGWGFYGHRLHLYRNTQPHRGFYLMLKWIKEMDKDYFVVTSNVDGQFQKAGFEEEKIYEIHGSIHHLQCIKPCCDDIWENNEEIPVDLETMRALKIPRCKHCGAVARPNVLMFGDWSWVGNRTYKQGERYRSFLNRVKGKRITVIEIGAGTAIPSIRHTSESLMRSHNAVLIRMNPREFQAPREAIALPMGGLEALESIDEVIEGGKS